MNESKLVDLILKIDSKTSAEPPGGLTWEKTAIEEEFQTTLSGFVIRVRHDRDSDSGDSYTLGIIDRTGATIESITDNMLRRIVSERSNDHPDVYPNELMPRLFTNARRRALGVDQAVDQLLKALK